MISKATCGAYLTFRSAPPFLFFHFFLAFIPPTNSPNCIISNDPTTTHAPHPQVGAPNLVPWYILRARSVDHKSTGSQSSGSQSTGSQIHWTGIRWIHHRIGVSNNNFKIWLYYQKSHQNHKRESKKSVPGILLYYIATRRSCQHSPTTRSKLRTTSHLKT